MNERFRILAIFAHPDDEIGAGGALAKYAHNGADVTLACATRGEAATIYCADCATSETLAHVRTGELECACRHLGIQRLEWLDWPDGGVGAVPMDQATSQLTALIREIKPHVLLTHPEHGTYPHPDHIGVHQRVVAAYDTAADPVQYPQLGSAWATPKLYVRAIPQTIFDKIPGFRDYRVKLNGKALPFRADPAAHIHCTLDCRDAVDFRIAAWACHVSQHNPNGTFSTMTPEMQREIFGFEYYRLLRHRLAADLTAHDSFLAGLPAIDHA